MIEEYSHNKDMEILNEYSLKKQSCKIYETNADWPKRKGQIYNYMEEIDTLLWNFARAARQKISKDVSAQHHYQKRGSNWYVQNSYL